jgi:hypothetical protein
LIIYCESESKPSSWRSHWNTGDSPVYWAGQWHYENGVPVKGAGQNS